MKPGLLNITAVSNIWLLNALQHIDTYFLKHWNIVFEFYLLNLVTVLAQRIALQTIWRPSIEVRVAKRGWLS